MPYILKGLGLNGEGIEIGVAKGYYSDKILNYSNLKVLYSVDPWEEKPPNFFIAKEKLEKYGTRSKIMRMTSKEASKHFTDKSLDFVYIDGDHSYEGVKQDIELWLPKTKGILAGHDYDREGVRQAVNECFDKVNVIPNETPSWWIKC